MADGQAKTLTSQKVMEFLADLGIETYFPPDGESWAHGITERAIQQVKETASLLQQDLPDQDPVLSIAMATSALNNTEYQKGFTSIQWAFGKQHQLDDDELRQQLSLPIDRQQHEFLRLMKKAACRRSCPEIPCPGGVVKTEEFFHPAADSNLLHGPASLHLAEVPPAHHLCWSQRRTSLRWKTKMGGSWESCVPRALART